MARRLLGTTSTIASRMRVYLADEAIEVDEIEGYTGTRKRVLFDEVVLITLDRRRHISTLVTSAALGLVLAGTTLATRAADGKAMSGITIATATIMASPFWLWFLAHLALGVDCVTVFGKRTAAQMRFFLRKRRAQAVFAQLRELVGQVQERERRRLAGAGTAPSAPGTIGAA
jgi:hypothetical protein